MSEFGESEFGELPFGDTQTSGPSIPDVCGSAHGGVGIYGAAGGVTSSGGATSGTVSYTARGDSAQCQ